MRSFWNSPLIFVWLLILSLQSFHNIFPHFLRWSVKSCPSHYKWEAPFTNARDTWNIFTIFQSCKCTVSRNLVHSANVSLKERHTWSCSVVMLYIYRGEIFVYTLILSPVKELITKQTGWRNTANSFYPKRLFTRVFLNFSGFWSKKKQIFFRKQFYFLEHAAKF